MNESGTKQKGLSNEILGPRKSKKQEVLKS
jgi:hypothetical protein